MRIKCCVCKKRREHAEGVREVTYGSEFHVGVEARTPMCRQCRKTITQAAFSAATGAYHALYVRRA